MSRRWTASRACASRCGRPMRGGVSLVGDFNSWDGRRIPLRLRHSAGVWELFVPRLKPGERYKYDITAPDGAHLPLKADPLARATEPAPATASIVARPEAFAWTDSEWMGTRARAQAPDAPIAIYEVHAGSWMRPDGQSNGTLDWRNLAERLIPYVTGLGFTHVELLPIMEHPFGGSWGYQPLSQFAPSARYGSPEDFAQFVDACHRANLGVILDWVPGHFPNDPHGLARFDGSALYEHEDPREGLHRDWNTCIYNFRPQRSAGVPDRERALLVHAVPCRRAARRWRSPPCSIPRLFSRARRMDPQPPRRTRKSGSDRIPAAAQRGYCGALSRRHHDRGRFPPHGRASPRRCHMAVLVFRTNGTWAGCTTRCVIWAATRRIAAGTMTI